MACIVAFVGIEVGAPVVVVDVVFVVVEVVFVVVVAVVVETGLPVFVRYLMPDDGQLPAFGASIGTNVPSMTLPDGR
jgi:hypothetical protein